MSTEEIEEEKEIPTQPEVQIPMLELHVADTEVATGVLPVTWCVRKDIIEKLNGMKNGYGEDSPNAVPYLLLVVAPVDGYHELKEQRHLIPLQELMTYVEFNHPGKNMIFGAIVWKGMDLKKNRDLHPRTFKERHANRMWMRDIFWEDIKSTNIDDMRVPVKQYYLDKNDEAHSCAIARIDVDVPAECFAKEPPEWEKEWVNLCFKYKAIDQCEFRKRRMLAYTVIPPFMLAIYLFRVMLISVLVSSFIRGINFKPITSPLTHGINDIIEDVGWTYFYKDKWLPPYNLVFLPFLPSILILVGALTYCFGPAVLIVYGVMVSVLYAFCILRFCADLFIKLINAEIPEWMKIKLKPKPIKKAKPIMSEQDVELLTCTHTTVAFKSIKDLPKSHRTVRLRFLDLKAKVCRPFSS